MINKNQINLFMMGQTIEVNWVLSQFFWFQVNKQLKWLEAFGKFLYSIQDTP